ncbi:hypothetical protein CcaverHIS002_0403990 [Cutaneotrichosporon cavernicola]|uniref:GH16 domain-containing protein n=1 Tax=Cutaneotrichosporon cavernicola TaxID=279322 RepID=A0AA48QVP8_9TREE|nr:uncharacterized protein CcaverHIS019_0403940 [Cutaneotrichosporon cavernicola]BEI83795.1 hypothetical protein CcaverHIS002_0403990 [Cutaneotrichosporon cavernicola]BEI91574.1 hypothetical protein CcaverHIS019_0403940 [Cutaneotrichosporon cavernicola]
MWAIALAAAALTAPVLAQGGATCNQTQACPLSAPCCSPYGFCGKAQFCLGGCEPLYSYQLTSCKPEPVCRDLVTDFTDLSRVMMNGTKYDGNATAWDWVVDAGKVVPSPTGDGARLTLTQEDKGTKISTTRYVHYGLIDFVMETSRWPGVVSAAITMSDVKDEIDFEWPGAVTNQVQSNFFFLGHVNYSDSNGGYHNLSGNTATSFHKYTINWQPDILEWWIDDKIVRSVKKADTWKESTQQYYFPTTPSRVQLSVWPAGIEGAAKGTVEWAGGMIDWTESDYINNGYFWNTIKQVSISCTDELPIAPDSTGYQFIGNDSDNVPMVGLTNRSTSMHANGAGTVSPVGAGLALALATSILLAFPAMAWVV